MSKKNWEILIPSTKCCNQTLRITDSIFKKNKKVNYFSNYISDEAPKNYYLVTESRIVKLRTGETKEYNQKYLVGKLTARLMILDKIKKSYSCPSYQVVENLNPKD